MSEERTGAQIMCEALIREGVDVMFGIPGGYIMPFYHAMPDYPQLRHVLCRHEQGAGHAADGYARATGRVGTCVATSGPGATNLTTALATAYKDTIPMVVITGQVSQPVMGRDAFQETDMLGVTMSITKHNVQITHGDDIARTMKEAFIIAQSGCPGPVLVDIPKDVQQARTIPNWHEQPNIPARFDHSTKSEIAAAHASRYDITGNEPTDRMYAAIVDAIQHMGNHRVIIDGNHYPTWAAHIADSSSTHIITPYAMGTSGFALPAALGAALAHPHETIWVLCSSGGFQMTNQDIQTMVQEGVTNVKIVVTTPMPGVMHPQHADYWHGCCNGKPLACPNLMMMAEAYHVCGIRVEAPDQIEAALTSASTNNMPTIIDVQIKDRDRMLSLAPESATMPEYIEMGRVEA